MRAAVLLALLVAGELAAQPTRVTCGPPTARCGPASSGLPGSVTTTTLPGPLPNADDFNRTTLGSNWAPMAWFPGTTTLNGSTINSAQAGIGPTGVLWVPNQPMPTVAYACARIPAATGSIPAGPCFANTATHDVICCGLDTTQQYWFWDTTASGYVVGNNTTFVPSTVYVGVERLGALSYRCSTSVDGKTWTAQTGPQDMTGTLTDGTRVGLYFRSNLAPVDCFETGTGALPTAHACCVLP